jgi:predicted phosphoadenosine phosphosulfate sulfurtransferase
MKKKIADFITKWISQGYPDGIPDEAPSRLEAFNKVGTYRMICIALMKNDHTLKGLGFSRPECQLYNMLKRKELIERGAILPSPQMELF